MICSACGAPLSVLKCQYCGHPNTAETDQSGDAESEALEERQYEIDSTQISYRETSEACQCLRR